MSARLIFAGLFLFGENNMKYTIEGFNQEKMVDWKLDCTDAVLLRFIVDFYLTRKMIKIKDDDGDQYFWLSYQCVIDELPLAGINNREVIARRLNKYVQCGLLKKYVYKKGGSYSCFCFTDKYQELIGKTQKSDLSTQKSTRVDSKVETKDSSTIRNTSTKDKRVCESTFIPTFKTKSVPDSIESEPRTKSDSRINDFFSKWIKSHPSGHYIITNYSKMGKQIKILLAAMEYDELIKRMTYYFENDKTFYVQAGHNFDIFVKDINALTERSKPIRIMDQKKESIF